MPKVAKFARYCPVCNTGRDLIPGAVIIQCGSCDVPIHCDNWLWEPMPPRADGCICKEPGLRECYGWKHDKGCPCKKK